MLICKCCPSLAGTGPEAIHDLQPFPHSYSILVLCYYFVRTTVISENHSLAPSLAELAGTINMNIQRLKKHDILTAQ